jgi:hypothetical protein
MYRLITMDYVLFAILIHELLIWRFYVVTSISGRHYNLLWLFKNTHTQTHKTHNIRLKRNTYTATLKNKNAKVKINFTFLTYVWKWKYFVSLLVDLHRWFASWRERNFWQFNCENLDQACLQWCRVSLINFSCDLFQPLLCICDIYLITVLRGELGNYGHKKKWCFLNAAMKNILCLFATSSPPSIFEP